MCMMLLEQTRNAQCAFSLKLQPLRMFQHIVLRASCSYILVVTRVCRKHKARHLDILGLIETQHALKVIQSTPDTGYPITNYSTC